MKLYAGSLSITSNSNSQIILSNTVNIISFFETVILFIESSKLEPLK